MGLSVVVPSNRDRILTTESIPDHEDIEVLVRRDPGLNRARNAGVEAARHEAILILDDDLVFETDWLLDRKATLENDDDSVYTALGTGILPRLSWPDGFTPGMGRVMGFHRRIWAEAGGFPEPCSHGGDTDFLMSAFEAGHHVVPLDHDWEHRDDDVDRYGLRDNLSWLWFLCRRHPKLVGPRLPELLLTKVRS